jgi:hypothetical protein
VGGVTALALALNLWALDRNGLGNSSYAATPPVLLVRGVDTATLRQPEPTPPPPLPTNLPDPPSPDNPPRSPVGLLRRTTGAPSSRRGLDAAATRRNDLTGT